MRARLLDLFSGAGGCARGYQMAGFHVTGVDIKPQPRYAGDVFIQGDALSYVAKHGHEFDAIHASPPCQAFTQMSARYRGKGGPTDDHPALIEETRAALERIDITYVIENVQGARSEMRNPIVLHGGSFGLQVPRPRLFESNAPLVAPAFARCQSPIGVLGAYPDGRLLWRRKDGTELRAASSIEDARTAMGIDWMEWREITQAIPPAYTEFIGRQLLAHLEGRAAA